MPQRIKPSIDVRLELLNKSPATIADALNRMTDALIKGRPDTVQAATQDYARLVGQTMALADAVGGKRALMELDHAARKTGRPAPAYFSTRAIMAQRFVAFADETPIFPQKAFTEAFEELLEREPRIARTAGQMRKAYAEGGFALLRISEKARDFLIKKIQKKIVEMGAAGVVEAKAKRVLAEMAGVTEAYAATVYRTNLAQAFTAGRKRQLETPEAQAVAPAFEFVDAGDADVRPNHRAARGLVAPVGHAVFDRLSPPLGFQCRCDLRLVDVFELKARGLLDRAGRPKTYYPPAFAKAGPDPGFK